MVPVSPSAELGARNGVIPGKLEGWQNRQDEDDSLLLAVLGARGDQPKKGLTKELL